MMNTKDMLKKMLKNGNLEEIIELAKNAQKEIEQDEAMYRHLIPVHLYRETMRKDKYPDWVSETVENVAKANDINIFKRGGKYFKEYNIGDGDFAKYIVYTCNDDGKTLDRVIKILLSAPAWCRGYGLTRKRMELVFHILVLHKVDGVDNELKKLLNLYDQTSLKVIANMDDAFRYTLNHEMQMIAFAERYVCNAIKGEAKFEYKAA